MKYICPPTTTTSFIGASGFKHGGNIARSELGNLKLKGLSNVLAVGAVFFSALYDG